MTPKPILYGMDMSPPVRAVLLTLKALNLDFDYVEVNTMAKEHKSPEYLKKNPQHTVPTLEDDGRYIWDSHAICAYLVRKYGKTDALYPKDFYQRAVVDQRLHFENGVIFMTLIKQSVSPLFRGTPTPEQLAELTTKCHELYVMLEAFLADSTYFAGKTLTIADLSIVSTVSSVANLAPIESSKYPKLAAWFESMKKLPYYEEANGKGLKKIEEFMKSKAQK